MKLDALIPQPGALIYLYDASRGAEGLILFLQCLLSVGDFRAVQARAMNPVDSFNREDLLALVQDLTEQHTHRSFDAVRTLASVAVEQWHAIRGRLILAGISDPMGLPSMHHVLDAVEAMILENMKDVERDEYLARMYPTNKRNGWDASEEMALFKSSM